MAKKQEFKAIETHYKGFRFRSRLEARYAVFFDELGIRYEYEVEGFTLPGGLRYLPDFWLPDYSWWVEIKGQDPPDADIEKLGLLAAHSRNDVYLLIGAPWDDDFYAQWFTGALPPSFVQKYIDQAMENEDYWLINAIIEYSLTLYYWGDLQKQSMGISPGGLPKPFEYDTMNLELCTKCGRIVWGRPDYELTLDEVLYEADTESGDHILITGPRTTERPATPGRCFECRENSGSDDAPLLKQAIARMKQARFEHGEKG